MVFLRRFLGTVTLLLVYESLRSYDEWKRRRRQDRTVELEK